MVFQSYFTRAGWGEGTHQTLTYKLYKGSGCLPFVWRNYLGGLLFLRPETRDVATRVSGSKWVQSTQLDIVNGSFCNLSKLAIWLALHIFATQCWRAPRRAKQLSTVAILQYIGSCHVGVSKRFSRSISLAVYRLSSIIEAILVGIVQEIAIWIDEVNSKEILFVIKPTRKAGADGDRFLKQRVPSWWAPLISLTLSIYYYTL